MSDTESVVGPSTHPPTGGKTLQSLERPRYKSWRKKYRKMRVGFDAAFDENRRLYREEQKLQGTAKRLKEELDGLREICLDLNSTPSIDPSLRYDLSLHSRPPPATAALVPDDITPERGNALTLEYIAAVRSGQALPLDLHVVREQVEQRLALQGVRRLHVLEDHVPHAYVPETGGHLPFDMKAETAPNLSALEPDNPDHPGGVSWLSATQERDYLLRLDAKTSDPFTAPQPPLPAEEKPLSDLTPREFDRAVELANPVSQHNWLRAHGRDPKPVAAGSGGAGAGGAGGAHAGVGADVDDNESLASMPHEPKPPPKKRGKKELAKRVGDRAVAHATASTSGGGARGSPAAASAGQWGEGREDEAAGFERGVEERSSALGVSGVGAESGTSTTAPSTGRKRGDGVGRGRGRGGGKGKRKRSGGDLGTGGSGSGGGVLKKVKGDRTPVVWDAE